MNAPPPCAPSAPDWLLAAALRISRGRPTATDRLWATPTAVMSEAGYDPDPWQRQVLESPARRTLLLCSRQAGKSLVAAALAVLTALREPGSLTLLLSPTLRQSGEL